MARHTATPEEVRRRRDRSAREATFPKCKDCGNVLGVDRANAGIKRCRGCLPDDELEDRDALAKVKFSILPKVQDPAAQQCIEELIRIVLRGNV